MLPASLTREISKKFGPYPSEDHSKVGITPVTDIAGFRARLLAAVARKTAILKWLIDREDWDLFLVVFSESHPAGHYFWHLHDPSYLTHPDGGAGALAHALRDVYVALDKAIGALLDSVDGNTMVILTSGDGMGPNYSGSHLLPQMLVRMGALSASPATVDERPVTGGKAGQRDLLRTVRDLIPQPIRIAISQAFLSRHTQEQLALRWKTAGIAWPATRAFVIENANEGYIRINLKGREPQGSVAPGREYDELCEELHHAARTATNPANGRPCARAVHKTDDIYDGPFRGHLPDVVIAWDPEAKVTTEVLTEKYGLIRAPAPSCGVSPFYSGNHWPNAFAVAVGPDVPKRVTLDPRSILDLAPTILGRFGIEAPAYMQGRILEELGSGAASPLTE
jgi:predicted AlkP superfamily phosphohydrolase/phosphomutase